MPTDAEKAQWAGIAAHMRMLMGHPEWETYQQEWALKESDAIHNLIVGGKEKYDYHKGYLEGLRAALTLPRELIAYYDKLVGK